MGFDVLLFGHRGAAGEAPENTLTGFAHAVRAGVRAFELDVRLTADGELVVLHDDSPLRTTGVAGAVENFHSAELAALDARLPHPTWPEAAPIPTLHQVLTAFPNMDAYQIEIKRAAPEKLPTICRRLVETIHATGVTPRVEISSFDAAALATMREIAPDLPRAYIGTYDSPSWIEQALQLGCSGACIPHKSTTPEVVQLAHQHHLAITGWPGNQEEELALLLAWPVAAITTDFPTRALAFLRTRQAQQAG
jgi:glycerophosphoryl diester phosphodiesterase